MLSAYAQWWSLLNIIATASICTIGSLISFTTWRMRSDTMPTRGRRRHRINIVSIWNVTVSSTTMLSAYAQWWSLQNIIATALICTLGSLISYTTWRMRSDTMPTRRRRRHGINIVSIWNVTVSSTTMLSACEQWWSLQNIIAMH
jgi:MFS family permease